MTDSAWSYHILTVPQMTPEVPVKNPIWMITTLTKFQVHTTIYTNMTPGRLQMTPEIPVKKSSLNDDYTHQVWSPLWPFIINMTPDDPRVTSDDPGSTSNKEILSAWWLHPPSFKSIQPFILIWPQMTPGWPQMTPEVPVKKSSLNDDYTNQVSSPYDPLY